MRQKGRQDTVISTVSESCPRCGASGTLRLKDTYLDAEGAPARTELSRFDCPHGCQIEPAELVAEFQKYTQVTNLR